MYMNNQSISSLYNFRNKIILISGSTGQIGESFVKLFLELGALVFGFDNHKMIFVKSFQVSF